MAVYGIRLARHDFTPLELADFVWELPDGCALWQSVGGSRAWSQETQMLALVEFRLRESQWQQGGKRNAKRPKMLEPPAYAAQREVDERRADLKADRWRARQRKDVRDE